MIFHQKEPVTAPRNIARHWSKARDVDGNVCLQPVTRHVCYLDRPMIVELRRNDPDRRLNTVSSWLNPSEVSESGYHANRPVAAHSEIRHIVEINDARNA